VIALGLIDVRDIEEVGTGPLMEERGWTRRRRSKWSICCADEAKIVRWSRRRRRRRRRWRRRSSRRVRRSGRRCGQAGALGGRSVARFDRRRWAAAAWTASRLPNPLLPRSASATATTNQRRRRRRDAFKHAGPLEATRHRPEDRHALEEAATDGAEFVARRACDPTPQGEQPITGVTPTRSKGIRRRGQRHRRPGRGRAERPRAHGPNREW